MEVNNTRQTHTTLGDMIRNYRENAGLTLSYTALQAGLSKGVLSKIENGDTKRPEWKTVKSIANALNIPNSIIVTYYIKVDHKIDTLKVLLEEAINSKEASLCTEIATKILESPHEDTFEALDLVYGFTVSDMEPKLKVSLYDAIITYTRGRGVQLYLAQSLFHKYMIERYDFTRLSETFKAGEEILYYIDQLNWQERVAAYHRLGLHAFHLNYYQTCIDLCLKGIQEDQSNTELKARSYLAVINSFLLMNQYSDIEAYLNEYEKFDFDFVDESAKLTRGIVNARKGNHELAIQQLQTCLNEMSPRTRIHAVNELVPIYFEIGDLDSIRDLIEKEDMFLLEQSETPFQHREIGTYSRLKGKYYIGCSLLEAAIDHYIDAILFYAHICAYEEINEIMQHILDIHTHHHKVIDLQLLEKLKYAYHIVNKHNIKIKGSRFE
ncbi:helix-turn-helix domain-containing protein [Brevibacillus dissolubilis]|uniref:helix-turn-helix domain-containing protein n=1 Tax=Brevibacillus dissolubilis TaxID=1844116 RepID=UPI001116D592|nr:helix-turn-helix domain-containing protein [Brevibacillus dissolubilis]